MIIIRQRITKPRQEEEASEKCESKRRSEEENRRKQGVFRVRYG